MNFEIFIINSYNKNDVKIVKDYINKFINKIPNKGLIIMGKSGLGNTRLVASIVNRLIENNSFLLKKNKK